MIPIRGLRSSFRLPDLPVEPGIEPPRPHWPKERSARLRELWDSGLTTYAIAEHLGVSRNAVMGRAHRMKLRKRPNPAVRHG